VERNHLEYLDVDGRIILKRFFKKWDGDVLTRVIGLRIGTGDVVCECGNEPSGSIKFGEFLD
jgi:hypothetical protein